MDKIYENNNKFKKNNLRGTKKTKQYSKRLIATSLVVFGFLINSGITNVKNNINASNYVYNKYSDVDLPYHYTVSSEGNYFYDRGNYYELSDGLKLIINDLTKQGATLEEIYYYLSNNYGRSMVNVYKDYLKENGEKVHLDEVSSKISADKEYEDIMNKERNL